VGYDQPSWAGHWWRVDRGLALFGHFERRLFFPFPLWQVEDDSTGIIFGNRAMKQSEAKAEAVKQVVDTKIAAMQTMQLSLSAATAR